MNKEFYLKLGIAFAVGIFIQTSSAFSAYNDVTIAASTSLSMGGYTLNITGSSAVLESITVGTSNFSVTMLPNSYIQVTSQSGNQMSVSNSNFTLTNSCASSSSVLTLTSVDQTGSVTVTPTTS